jgi:hypothetical protein
MENALGHAKCIFPHKKRKVAMTAFIATNTIKSVKTHSAVNQAVLEAIGEREGNWRVSVAETSDEKVWNVAVKGPNGFQWQHQFDGKDRTPFHVGKTIRASLEKSDEEIATALSELVKEGVIFTREVRPDGEVEYVIDRVRLSGEDVKYLRSRGALTRHGIEQYLVDRR